MATTITMPSLGESVAEGEVGKWLVQEGDAVAKDQALVEIMTDKADSEIPATTAGLVTKLLVHEGDTVAVGDALCEIDAAAVAAAPPAGPPPKAPGSQGATAKGTGAISSPTVRKLAREADVNLGQIAGSGDGGRVTRADVLQAAAEPAQPEGAPATRPASKRPPRKTDAAGPTPQSARARAEAISSPAAGPRGAFKLPAFTPAAGDEVVAFTRRRRIIADHMVYSKITAPHVVTFAECDLHRTSKLRAEHKADFKKENLGLTYLAFVAVATCRALLEFRELNARVLDDAYALLHDVNLGIAVDTPQGLVVPVVQHADELTIRGIARAIDEIATKARDGKLLPDDLAGKTFTISNPGRRGNLVGGAIISQPNVGILRMGEIKKRVVVIEHEGEDLMAIHPVMHMALSYDHRIVDGVNANGFLWRVVEILESADFEM